MKKISPALVLLGLAAVIAIPSIGLAQEAAPDRCTIRANTGIVACPGVGQTAIYTQTYGTGASAVSGAICCLFSTINYIINWIFFILLIVAVIVGILGAYNIITSGGSAEKVETGRKLIMYAIIGVIVAMFAKAIPAIAKMFVGVS
jgi:FtsH-binding integral membrane protein